MPCSAIIRGAFCFRRWEQIQRPRARVYAENERLQTLNLKRDVSIKSLLSGSGNFAGEEAEKVQEAEGMEGTKESRPSRHNWAGIQWTHRGQDSMPRACSDGVLEPRGEVDT